jgi:hypothetical protein
VMLTTHPLLVPRLRKSRSYTSCHPDAPLWSVTGPLFYLFTVQTSTAITWRYCNSPPPPGLVKRFACDRLNQAIKLLICIRWVPGSKLGQNIFCSVYGVSLFCSVPPRKCRVTTIKSAPLPFPPTSQPFHYAGLRYTISVGHSLDCVYPTGHVLSIIASKWTRVVAQWTSAMDTQSLGIE